MPSAGLTRQQQLTQRRELIRSAALDLIELNGFDHTTIDQISAKARIGRRTFFRYFSCKEAVLFSDVFGELADNLAEALDTGLPPVRALITAIERDAYGSEDPDETTIRRRKLRVSLLNKPAVANFYREEIGRMAEIVTQTVRAFPQYGEIPFLPELVGGLLHTMTMAHLKSGETHHFSVDEPSWRQALTALAKSF